jgi:hypothetical protein
MRYDYPVAKGPEDLVDPGHTKLIIFNSTDPRHFQWTGKMNVHLNGKGAAQLEIHEYIQLIVPRGRYEVELLHHDLVAFRSTHVIELMTSEAYLEVYATILSNEARIVSEIPKELRKILNKRLDGDRE